MNWPAMTALACTGKSTATARCHRLRRVNCQAKLRMIGDLVIHPAATEIEHGMAYTMPHGGVCSACAARRRGAGTARAKTALATLAEQYSKRSGGEPVDADHNCEGKQNVLLVEFWPSHVRGRLHRTRPGDRSVLPPYGLAKDNCFTTGHAWPLGTLAAPYHAERPIVGFPAPGAQQRAASAGASMPQLQTIGDYEHVSSPILMIAEHFHVPGIVTKICATREKAVREAQSASVKAHHARHDAGKSRKSLAEAQLETAIAGLQDEYATCRIIVIAEIKSDCTSVMLNATRGCKCPHNSNQELRLSYVSPLIAVCAPCLSSQASL